MGRGGSAVVSLTAVDAGGHPVATGAGGMQLFVSLRLATSAAGRSLGSDATAVCGQTTITVVGVFCQAPANGVARVQVRRSAPRRKPHKHCLCVSLRVTRFHSVFFRSPNSQRGGPGFESPLDKRFGSSAIPAQCPPNSSTRVAFRIEPFAVLGAASGPRAGQPMCSTLRYFMST